MMFSTPATIQIDIGAKQTIEGHHVVTEVEQNAASIWIMLDEADVYAQTIRTDGITSMILLPWRSQFVHDTRVFLKRRQWLQPSPLPDLIETGVRKSRLSLKFGDDRGTDSDELVAACINAEDDMRRECAPSFLSQIGWDTGIYYDAKTKNLAGTTTASCIWSGFELPALMGSLEGECFTFAYGYYIGMYTAELAGNFGMKLSLPRTSTQLAFRYRDVRADEYFSYSWNPTNEDKRYLRLVSSIACLVAASRLIRQFELNSPILEIKMALCALLHGASTLRSLIENNSISWQFRQLLKKATDFDLVTLGGYQNANKLRNVLFHYGVPKGLLKDKYVGRQYVGLFESAIKMDSISCLNECRRLIEIFWRNLSDVVETVAEDNLPLLD